MDFHVFARFTVRVFFFFAGFFSFESTAGLSTPRMKLDFPDPEIPAMTVRRPMGILTSIFCRLFAVAPFTFGQPSLRFFAGNLLRSPRIGCRIGSENARRVGESDLAADFRKSFFGSPCQTTSPPNFPAPGP